MSKFLITVIGLAISISSHGQFTLSGEVRDAQTNQTLPGATVRLEPLHKFSVSDQSGQFRFEKIPAGDYEVTVSYVGYEKSTSGKVALRENSSINIRLNASSTITDEIVVTATRSSEKTPTTFTTIQKEALQKQNFGQDVPFLLNWTPSVVTTSDAGTGIGYTGIRIRGSDPTRVNVTINGIPYNDAESLGTFWVDIPDIASSAQSIQIQRGVGTSTNGAGAFGGTINVQTNTRNDQAYAESINAFGSFDTRRHSLLFGSGLINEHWIVEGRVSRIKSDGFIDRGFSDLASYYFSGGFYDKGTILKAVVFGGTERTYQAWYGVPESRLNNNQEQMEMTVVNEGWNEEQAENLFTSDSRTFNLYTYENQVDDYQQDNYQLHFSQKINQRISANAALHYTPGKGYYEEYKYDAAFADYGLPDYVLDDDGDPSDNDTVATTDLVRRRWLDNDFYGFTYSVNVDQGKWTAIWGGGWNRYDGDHFGELIWAEISPVATGYRYYFNNGDKRDFNTYVKINYDLSAKLNLFLDLQYRGVSYEANGIDNDRSELDIGKNFSFFNPKAGATYRVSENQALYASYAIANREPLRDDFLSSPDPEHETLHNIEAGYRRTGGNFQLNANYYLMQYKNQLVLTGELNDVGAFQRTNAGKSYRTGIELEGNLKISNQLHWNANLTLSRNKIDSFKDVLIEYEDYTAVATTYKNTDISFSPGVIVGSQLAFRPVVGTEIALLSKYVGKQYLDNTSNNNRVIDPYFVNDVRLTYAWRPGFVREVNFSLLINNIIDEKYESNGYTWAYLYAGEEHRENYYYPQAGRNFIGMVSIRF
ncbi:MAG TPA: TonB-dependent receptor [Chryseosolibacter sp.]|nr:TonB-dependent receptor [Chryseosolibacter sp.]